MKYQGTRLSKTRRLSALALCIGAFLYSPQAAEAVGTNLTLQAALDYGTENNGQLQAAFNQWQAAVQNITVQRALPDPVLTYGYYFEPVETRVGPQEQSIGLSQRFPAFGKLSAMEAIATDIAEAAQHRYQREKLDLEYAITKAYAELYYLERNIAITRDRMRLISDLEEVARARYRAGSPMAPVLQAQVELGRLEDRLTSLQDLLEPRRITMNALLNRPANAPLSISASLPYRQIAMDAARPTGGFSQTSPELRELAANIEQGTHQLMLARRVWLPDFTVGIAYIDTGDAAMPASDSGKDPVIGSIGITLPIWAGKNRAQIAVAARQQKAARLRMDNRTQSLDADIQQVLFNLRDADRKINLYKESLIPKARQSLEVNRKAYEAGQMEFINLVDAERMLLEFELAHERALADHLIARAELGKLTGIDYLAGMEGHQDTKDSRNQHQRPSS